ncbi:glycosyltransferase family 2 protein [Acinetobacter sp. YH16037]|uniref:glycosyltransferase family 2 protein n=1 Tax=Acinetobacter sp. YH16037 TaxID=2601182 RepID=UPI0015D25174|nr:glycosyltransferase family 2 protein [Acinetobacter sp. YH16037]
MPFISVIVPIYNMEKYIVDLLESLVNQTYKNFEVILVNDGSTDQSLDICNQYVKCDSRFKLYSKINGGVALARQYGLEKSTGLYIIHADPDDYLANDALELMVAEVQRTKCDICIGSYSVAYPNKEIKVNVNGISNTQDFIKKLALNQIHGALWNKLIKSDVCKDTAFLKDINYMEDKLYLTKILKKNKDLKISCINSNVYFYRQRSNSYTNENSNNRSLEKFRASSEIFISLLTDILTKKEIKEIRDLIEIQIALNKHPKDVAVGKFGLKMINRNLKWYFNLIGFFLIFGIRAPLYIFSIYSEKKKQKLGIY